MGVTGGSTCWFIVNPDRDAATTTQTLIKQALPSFSSCIVSITFARSHEVGFAELRSAGVLL
jgi:hypothetical protein